MVGLGRVELPTSPLSGVRSNQLSYRPPRLSVEKRCLEANRLTTELKEVIRGQRLNVHPSVLGRTIA